MKRLFSLFAVLLISSAAMFADETVTVNATSADISSNLDLKAVAKLFAQSANLEEFETLLNNPDSAYSNLDLNGDGEIDYLRVVETGEGNQRLIILQAILAKDIYQDVASIYVERDEATNNVSVQVVGDEYIYGKNYVIEPVYIYRPVIYDWFWGPSWVCWHSPYYWGYYPGWWRPIPCWDPIWYCHHIHIYHHYTPYCSFRYARAPRPAYRDMGRSISRRDYAAAHPERSFATRNANIASARDLPRTAVVNSPSRSADISRGASAARAANMPTRSASSATASRTFGSTHVPARATASAMPARSASSSAATRSTASATTRSSATSTTTTRTSAPSVARTSTTSATPRSTSASAASRSSYSTGSAPARSSYSTSSASRSSYSSAPSSSSRSSYSTSSSPRSSYSGGGYSSGGYSGSASHGGFSGGGARGGGSPRR